MRTSAEAVPGGAIDLTVGSPIDEPPSFVSEVLAASSSSRGYPASLGSAAYRNAAVDWLRRRFEVELDAAQIAATIGSKEFVAGLPHWLRLLGREANRDVVLHPAIAYPTYAMGARLAGCESFEVPSRPDGRLDLSAIPADVAARALCIWSNSPSNPTGELDDLAAIAEWGRARSITVVSDECYAELTWDGPPRTILQCGTEGVIAVHSLSKRSNLAGLRAGFFAGDRDLVADLGQLRKHAGFMVAGAAQEVATAAFNDDQHAEDQRDRYRRRLELVAAALRRVEIEVPEPRGGFYLWISKTGYSGDELAVELAAQAGILSTPGRAYGERAEGFARLAMVCSDDQACLAAERIARLNFDS